MNRLVLTLGALMMVQAASAAPKWDANADGKMSRDEFVTMAYTRTVERADTDKDGKVSLAEWNARPAAIKATADGRDASKGFSRLDVNSDGFVEAADFSVRFGKRFDRLDADKDGVLTGEERQAARDMLRGQTKKG